MDKKSSTFSKLEAFGFVDPIYVMRQIGLLIFSQFLKAFRVFGRFFSLSFNLDSPIGENQAPRRELHSKFHQSGWRFDSFEQSSAGLFVVDRYARIVDTNKKAATLLSCSKVEILGRPLATMLDHIAAKKVSEFLKGASIGPSIAIICLMKRPCGSYFNARLDFTKCDSSNENTKFFVAFRDVSHESSILRVTRVLAKFTRFTSECKYLRDRAFLLASLDRVSIPVIGIVDSESQNVISLYFVESKLRFLHKKCQNIKTYLDLDAVKIEYYNKDADLKRFLTSHIDLDPEKEYFFDLNKIVKDIHANKVIGFVSLITTRECTEDSAMADFLEIFGRRLCDDILWFRNTQRQAGLQKALEKAVDVQTAEIIEQKEKLELEAEARNSAEKDLVAAMQRAEKANQAKSHFLANMSHEIRTPLNGIIGASSLLSNLASDQQQQEYIDTILHSGNVLLNLVNDILDLSKIEDGEFALTIESFSLRKILNEIFATHNLAARRRKIDFFIFFPHNQPDFLSLDRERLRQVLDNLISNAIKFTEKGGVYVYVKVRKQGKDGILQAVVKDTGPGISLEDQSVIWRRFSQIDMSPTRKFGGFGLGLPIAFKLISIMKGRIILDSDVGRGSQFSLWIPVKGLKTADKKPLQQSAIPRIFVKDNDLKKGLHQMLSSASQAALKAQTSLDIDPSRIDPFIFDCSWIEEYKSKAPGIFERFMKENEAESFLLSTNAYKGEVKYAGFKILKLSDILSSRHALDGTKPFLATKKFVDSFAPCSQPRILMAEDNPINIKVGLDMLCLLGAKVSLAKNGRSALDKARSECFDLILMDCFMPEMDGVDAMQAIKRSLSECPPIVAVTANAVKGEKERYLSLGFDDYLAKPYRIDELRSLLYKYFAEFN